MLLLTIVDTTIITLYMLPSSVSLHHNIRPPHVNLYVWCTSCHQNGTLDCLRLCIVVEQIRNDCVLPFLFMQSQNRNLPSNG